MPQKRIGADFQTRYGPWALVAGASEGLGAEYARQLAAKGLNLVLIARRQELLETLSTQLIGEYGIQVRNLPLDLARDDLDAVVTEATGDIEIGLLVYNAAVSMIGPYFEIALDDHLREIAVNCRAPLTLAYRFGQLMIKRKRGGIILMSSLGASQGSALISNYAATKAYNKILAEGLWEELRMQGIAVLTCCPSAVSTPGYLASTDRGSVTPSTPRAVVSETLAALGKQPVVIPGWTNRLANVLMMRVMPHTTAIKLMGRVLRSMYQHTQ